MLTLAAEAAWWLSASTLPWPSTSHTQGASWRGSSIGPGSPQDQHASSNMLVGGDHVPLVQVVFHLEGWLCFWAAFSTSYVWDWEIVGLRECNTLIPPTAWPEPL